MRYHHLEGATQKQSPSKKRWFYSVPLITLVVGAYVVVNMNAPVLQGIDGRPAEATAQKLMTVQPGKEGNRLYLPQINVDIAIMQGDDRSALESGAWHRKSVAAGDPESGGAFVLGARSLSIGMTPAETKAASPFYHLNKLQTGDELFVDWNGKRHVYEVKKRVMADTIDAAADQAQDASSLLLYVADVSGELEQDIVIRAERVGHVAWGQKPVIQRTQTQ